MAGRRRTARRRAHGRLGSVGDTVIQLPVPALEPLVRANLSQDEPWLVPADSATICSHITLLGPFLPEEDVDDRLPADLAGFFAAERPFMARLASAPGPTGQGEYPSIAR